MGHTTLQSSLWGICAHLPCKVFPIHTNAFYATSIIPDISERQLSLALHHLLDPLAHGKWLLTNESLEGLYTQNKPSDLWPKDHPMHMLLQVILLVIYFSWSKSITIGIPSPTPIVVLLTLILITVLGIIWWQDSGKNDKKMYD
jgi:hypothetical protein